MVEMAEGDVHLNFSPLFLALLEDDDEGVRSAAVEGLWEHEDPSLIQRLLSLLNLDSVDAVRASAAHSLGRFVARGELEFGIHRKRAKPAVDRLVEIAEDEREDSETRRRALAAAGYADRQDVRNAIEFALRSEDSTVLAGAIRAMGNSADASWGESVLDWLTDDDPELRFEAVRAAGELELQSAVTPLVSIAQFETDVLLRTEAIWALGEIGGIQAKRALERVGGSLANHEDALTEAVDEALAQCALIEGELDIAPFDFGAAGGGAETPSGGFPPNLQLLEDQDTDELDEDDTDMDDHDEDELEEGDDGRANGKLSRLEDWLGDED
jgi:HEAT repeat protein